MNGYLGLDMLAGYRLAQSKRKPYHFNIMVVGESGTGKSTFINTFFHAALMHSERPRDLSKTREVTVHESQFSAFCRRTVCVCVCGTRACADVWCQHAFCPAMPGLEEKGVKVQLTVIDTPGFGDNLNRSHECVVFATCAHACC